MVGVGTAIGGRYRLVEPVASGGMAQVWRARDEVLGRPVAVKILHPHLAGDQAFLVRFRREAVAAARLSHQGIVAIYDTVSTHDDEGCEAIVMELIEGPTLRSVLDERAPLSSEELCRLGVSVADALSSAHRAGVVHRDIKPSNILLVGGGPEGAVTAVKVTDFGIAKAGEDTDLTVTGTLLGTAKYLSPEQVRGEAADPRSDLYSLGVVLFEAATGSPPFLADTDAATALVRLHDDAPSVRSRRDAVPVALAAVIDRLLARDPDARFESAAALRLALLAAESTSDPATDPTTTLDATGPGAAAFDRTTAMTGPAPAGAGSAVPHGTTASGPVTDSGTHPDTRAGDDEPGYLAPERSLLLPAVVVILLGAGLVVAALLISDSSRPAEDLDEQGQGPVASDADGSTTLLTDLEEVGPPVIAGVAAFDPEGDGSENNDRLLAILDGDPETTWATDTYKREGYAGLKDGVGIIVSMEGPSEVSRIEVVSPSSNWTIAVFVGSGADPAAGGARGEPAGELAVGEVGGVVATELSRSSSDGEVHPPVGTWLLLWITDPGTSPPSEAEIARFEAERGDAGADPSEGSPESIPGDAPPANRFELAELTVS